MRGDSFCLYSAANALICYYYYYCLLLCSLAVFKSQCAHYIKLLSIFYSGLSTVTIINDLLLIFVMVFVTEHYRLVVRLFKINKPAHIKS